MKRQVPIWPVIGLAILILAGVGYMLLIRPKRAETGRLDEQITEMQMKVTAARLASRPQQSASTIKVADVFEVSKAMPDTDDMPGIILDLNSVAEATGIKFLSIQPSAPTPKAGYSAIQINLTFEGNYFDLTDFLFRLRNLVTVRDGRLSSSGRLFTLDTLSMKRQQRARAQGDPLQRAVRRQVHLRIAQPVDQHDRVHANDVAQHAEERAEERERDDLEALAVQQKPEAVAEERRERDVGKARAFVDHHVSMRADVDDEAVHAMGQPRQRGEDVERMWRRFAHGSTRGTRKAACSQRRSAAARSV